MTTASAAGSTWSTLRVASAAAQPKHLGRDSGLVQMLGCSLFSTAVILASVSCSVSTQAVSLGTYLHCLLFQFKTR